MTQRVSVVAVLVLVCFSATVGVGEDGVAASPARDADELTSVAPGPDGGESEAGHTAPDLLQQTIKDMKTLAIAIGSFAIDENLYPGPTFGWEEASMLVATLERYIAEVPTHDAWGRSLLYWCDLQSYRLVSPGPDGEVAQQWQGATEAEDSSADDIVHGDGFFIHPPS